MGTLDYRTKDLAESSLLLAKNQQLKRIEKDGKIIYFIFEGKTDCEKLANEFWFGQCLINAKTYYDAMSTLKKKIFSVL